MEMNLVDLLSRGGGMSTGFAKQGSFKTTGAVDLEVAKPSYGVGATNCNDTHKANLGLRPLSANIAHTPPKLSQSTLWPFLVRKPTKPDL